MADSQEGFVVPPEGPLPVPPNMGSGTAKGGPPIVDDLEARVNQMALSNAEALNVARNTAAAVQKLTEALVQQPGTTNQYLTELLAALTNKPMPTNAKGDIKMTDTTLPGGIPTNPPTTTGRPIEEVIQSINTLAITSLLPAPQLAKFKGNKTGIRLEDWIVQAQDLAERTRLHASGMISHKDLVLAIAAKLEGLPAQDWANYQTQLTTNTTKDGRTWDDFTLDSFFDFLKARWIFFGEKERRRHRYDTCRQGNRSFQEYYVKLERLYNQLDVKPNDHEFYQRCKAGTAARITRAMYAQGIQHKDTNTFGLHATRLDEMQQTGEARDHTNRGSTSVPGKWKGLGAPHARTPCS
ncbi:Retrotransposon gag domain [Ceraceosorus bombacis]|uniref:Retrotransposon gag domain n=1 Tax=Ceraceosorus bombacis TaxID=401625 RepID=A0A0P1BIV1_9BASI|nr:Retrotransposon gag domain [Ceraceosorus bombacis]